MSKFNDYKDFREKETYETRSGHKFTVVDKNIDMDDYGYFSKIRWHSDQSTQKVRNFTIEKAEKVEKVKQ